MKIILKTTTALMIFIMKYQGHDSKNYIIQKVSVFISGFLAIFISNIIALIPSISQNDQFYIFLISFVILFLAHYFWILFFNNKKISIHYKEYKKYLSFFVVLICLCILIPIMETFWDKSDNVAGGKSILTDNFYGPYSKDYYDKNAQSKTTNVETKSKGDGLASHNSIYFEPKVIEKAIKDKKDEKLKKENIELKQQIITKDE